MKIATSMLLTAGLLASPSWAGTQTPTELGELPQSPDGDAVVVVLDGARARRVVGGVEVGSTSTSGVQALGAGACGTALSSFLTSGVAAEGDTPIAAAFTPDATRIVVAHMSSKNLVVFDANTRAVLDVIALSGTPVDLAVSADNVHAVTANIWEDTASIVNLTTGVEQAVVPVGNQPACVRFTPSGARAVVGNAVDQSLSWIDIASASELARISGAGFQSMTTISFEPGVITYKINGFEVPSETLAVHADNLANQIDFFDLTAGNVTSLACDPAPRGIAMTPSGSKIVVSHFASARKVTVVDPVTRTITKVITAPNDLDEPISIRPDGAKAAVSVLNGTQILDLTTDTWSAVLSTASVNRMLSTPDGLYAFAVGFNGSLISYASATIVKNLNGVISTYVGAVAPSGQRAALIANHNGEEMLVVNTNGASGFLEARVPTGPPPEGDATRDVAISVGGSRAVTTNNLSDNASVIDFATGAVLAIVPVGDRPADVEITPDGTKAVVANLDSTFASVINLSSFAVTNVPISTRGSEVEISPNGQYAYVAVVSSGDGVWRIDLTTNTVAGAKLATGDMGSVFYMFQQASGMTLSPDGATLAVCGSFTNNVTLIDTATWTVDQTVAVGAHPTRAAFSADSKTVYVANKNANTLSVVHDSGTWSVTGTIAVGSQPFEMAVNSAAQRLYVCNAGSANVGIVDLATNATLTTVPVVGFPQALHLSPNGSCLHVAAGNWFVAVGPGPLIAIGSSGEVDVIDTATASVVQTLDTDLPPATMEFDALGMRGAVPSPFGDGLTRVTFGGVVASYCTAKTNSHGCAPPISSTGSPSVSAGSGFVLQATQVLPSVSGIFFYSTNGAAATPYQGGLLCVIPPTRRTPVQNSGGAGVCGGTFSMDFNTYIASGADPALVAGATFWAQCWSRDPASVAFTNLTNALTATIDL